MPTRYDEDYLELTVPGMTPGDFDGAMLDPGTGQVDIE